MTAPYDDGWLLDDTEALERLAAEIKLNDPRTTSLREAARELAQAAKQSGKRLMNRS